MKTRRGVVGCLVLIMFVAALVACASTAKQSSTGEYVDDSVITTKDSFVAKKATELRYAVRFRVVVKYFNCASCSLRCRLCRWR